MEMSQWTPETTLSTTSSSTDAGTALLKHLVAIARDLGLREFRAEVLAENRAMLHVFSHSGLPMRQTTSLGITEVYLSLARDRIS
jgi:RimJ/RimL family protein N-acetyltransferase